MTSPRRLAVLALAVAMTATLAACGTAGEAGDEAPTPTETTAAPVEACAVAGPGGFDDAGLNQQVLAGLSNAKNDQRLGGMQTLRTKGADGIGAAVRSMLDSQCGVIVAPGPGARQVRTLAAEYPDQPFVLAGGGAENLPESVATLNFDQRGAAFLAGYTAATLSESEAVATFGGARNRATVRAMDAFAAGVEQYNTDQRERADAEGATPEPTAAPEEAPRQVRLLGWDRGKRTGEFPRTSEAAKAVAEDFASAGADVLFPVAGDDNLAITEAIEAAEAKAGEEEQPAPELEALAAMRLVWSGANGRSQLSAPAARHVMASIVLHTEPGYDAVLSDWTTGTDRTPIEIREGEWTGDLGNEGVTFQGPGEAELLTAVGLEGRLSELREAIIAGEIDVD